MNDKEGFTLVTDTAKSYRHHFPVFDSVTYINSCSQGALSDRVRAAMDLYLNGMDERGSLWEEWVSCQEDVRGLIARLFSTTPDQVALTTSASAAASSVLSSIDFSKGKSKIVTTSLEFPTMGQIAHAQELRGAEIVHVSAESENILDLGKFEKALDDKTALVLVTHVCFRNGAMTDIKSIVNLAHARGIPVMVDAYQSVGSLTINFEELGADFLIGGVLKYMLGCPGLGFMLVNKKNIGKYIPTQTGWFAARDIFAMDISKYDPAIDARRFESGTPPVPSLYAGRAGLELLLEVGTDNAWAHTSLLHDQLREGVLAMGGKIATPAGAGNHGVMLAVKSRDEHAHVDALANEKVVVSCRDSNVRISPHFYNNHADIETCLKALAKHKHLLA